MLPKDIAELSAHINASIAGTAPQANGLRKPSLGYGEDEPNHALTEDNIALRFAQRYRDRLRFCHQRQAWLAWSGTHWERDRTGAVVQAVRRHLREENVERSARWGKAAIIAAIERLARSDPRLATNGSEFDSDPLLIGTPNGTIDLRDGRLREANPADMISRRTAIGPDFDAPCPVWTNFLKTTTQGDDELTCYLQRLCGYVASGRMDHQLVHFVFGLGGNGKSVFMNVLRDILHEYAVTVAVEAFLQTHHDRHPADLATIQGARLITTGELPDNREWNEQRIKDISGGEKMAARWMHGNPFEFRPTGKLVFVGNHKPKLRNVNDAIRRRFRLIPFTRKVPDNERDFDLEHKLQGEYPAILAWMVHGATRLQTKGMSAATTIDLATSEYFSDNDTLRIWLDECCEVAPHLRTKASELRRSYDTWCEENASAGKRLTPQDFKDQVLGSERIYAKRGSAGIIYEGIALKGIIYGKS